MFTGWTTHSFHLCRPRRSNATILPPTPHPCSDLSCRSGSLTCGGTGGGGGDRQTFSVESHFPVVSSFCVFQVLAANEFFFFKGEEKALNISTCGTSVTWLFPFQTLDLCLPATTQDARSRGGGERCGQSGNAEDGGEDYAKCRPLLNMSWLSIIHRSAQTSLQILSQPRSHSDEAWRQLSISTLHICRCYATENVPNIQIWVKRHWRPLYMLPFNINVYNIYHGFLFIRCCMHKHIYISVSNVGRKLWCFCQMSDIFTFYISSKSSPRGPQFNRVFFPSRQKTASTKESGNPGERVLYLVGQKTWLGYDPRGLDFHTTC